MKYKNFTKLALLFLNINNVYSKTHHDDKHINNIDYNMSLDTTAKMQTSPFVQNDFVAHSTAPNNNVSFIATSITTAYVLSNSTNRPKYNRGNILVHDNRADEETSQQPISQKLGQNDQTSKPEENKPKPEQNKPIPKPEQNQPIPEKDQPISEKDQPISEQKQNDQLPKQESNNQTSKHEQENKLSRKENTNKNTDSSQKPSSMKEIKHQLQNILIESVIREDQIKNNKKKEISKQKHVVTRSGRNTSNNTTDYSTPSNTAQRKKQDNTLFELNKQQQKAKTEERAHTEERETINLLRQQLSKRIAKFSIPEKDDLQQQINNGNLIDLIHITDLITALEESLAANTSRPPYLPQLKSRIKPIRLTQGQKEDIFFNNTLKLFCEFLIEKNPAVYNQFIKSVKYANVDESNYYAMQYMDIEIINNQQNNIYEALDGVLEEYSEEVLDGTINKSKYVIQYKNREIILIIRKSNHTGSIHLLSFEDLSAQNPIPAKEILINNYGGSYGLEGNQCGIASFMHSILEKIIYVQYLTTQKLSNIEQNTLQNFIDKCNMFLRNSVSKAKLNHQNLCLLELAKIQGKDWYEHVYRYMRDLYLSLHTIADMNGEGGRQLDIHEILFFLQNNIGLEDQLNLVPTGREYISPTYDEKVVLPYFQQINLYRLGDKGRLLEICRNGANGHFVNKIKFMSENGDFSFYNFFIASIKSYNDYLSKNKLLFEKYFTQLGAYQRQYSGYYNKLNIEFFQPVVAKINKESF